MNMIKKSGRRWFIRKKCFHTKKLNIQFHLLEDIIKVKRNDDNFPSIRTFDVYFNNNFWNVISKNQFLRIKYIINFFHFERLGDWNSLEILCQGLPEYKQICMQFYTGNMSQTCIKLWFNLSRFTMSKHLQIFKSFKSVSHWKENFNLRT